MDAALRLRIAFVTDTWDGTAGGVVAARRTVAALRTRHEVTVVTAGEADGEPVEEEGRVCLPAFYPPFARRVMRENGFVFAVPRRRVLTELFRRVDLVHVQFPFWLGLRAAATALEVGTPLVSAFHVQPENLLRNVGLRSPGIVEATYRLFLRRLFQRSDAVVCPSPFALELLRARGLTAHAEVISNGVGPGFGPGPDARPERHRGKLLVAVVGRLAREKRVDVAIEGVRRSRHAGRIQLVVTGRGPEERAVRRLGATLPVPAEVGWLPDEDLHRLLRSADLMIHASEVELEGLAVLEGLASGTPALLARAPASAARQFALSDDFLFEPGDPADLARRLDALLDNPARLERARTECLERASAHRLESSLDRLEALYRRVVAAARTGAPDAASAPGAPAARSTARPAAR